MHRKKTVRKRWIFSFLLMLLLPLAIMMVSFSFINSTISQNVRDYNYEKLSKGKNSVDVLLSQMDTISSSIAGYHAVHTLLEEETMSPGQVMELVREIQKLTDNICLYNENIKDILLAIPGRDMAVSINTATNLKYYTYSYFGKSPEHIQYWNEMYRTDYQGNFLLVDVAQMSPNWPVLPVYAKTIGEEGDKINIFIVVNLAQIFSLQSEQENFFILNEENTVVSALPKATLPEEIRYELLPEKSGAIDLKDKKLIALYMKSSVTPWSYVMVSSKDVFMSGVDRVTALAVIGLLICLLLGSVLAMFLTQRNYLPVKEVMGSVSQLASDEEPSEAEDEFHYIKQVIHSVATENKQLNRDWNLNRQILKEHFLENLMTYRIYAADAAEKMAHFGIVMDTEFFVVMRLLIEEYDQEVFGEDMAAMFYAIKNISEEIINTGQKGYVTESNASVFLIVNLSEEAEGASLQDDAQTIISVLRNAIGVGVDVIVSRMHKTLAGIPEAYKETIEAAEYKQDLASGEIMLCDRLLRDDTQEFYQYPADVDYRIINSIKLGDYQAASAVVDEVLAAEAEDATALPVKKFLTYDLVGLLIKAIGEVEKATCMELPKDAVSISALMADGSIARRKERILETMKNMCAFVRANAPDQNKISSRIKSYVVQNYADLSLNISTIALHMGMNAAYIARVFKQETGGALLDYINSVRVEAAKAYLKTNGRSSSMENLAEMFGFSNTRTFRRVFTKYTGMPPTKYIQ